MARGDAGGRDVGLSQEELSAALGGANARGGSLLSNSSFVGRRATLGTFRPGVGYDLGGGSATTQFNRALGIGDTDYEDAIMAPLSWDQSRLSNFVNTGILNKAPGFEPGMGMPQIQQAWQSMVEASIAFNERGGGGKQWTPWDVLNSWGDAKKGMGTERRGDWIVDLATNEKIKYVGPRSKTVTEKHVDLSSPEDVRAIATQALRELLGRAPTADELAQFRSSINAQEKANPTVTTTTQTLTPDLASGTVDVTESSSTTSGGFSDAARAAVVADPTKKTKEFGKYQSATTYWDAMMQMISGG